jgi:hypothetical protein
MGGRTAPCRSDFSWTNLRDGWARSFRAEASVKLNPVGEGRKQLCAHSAAATSTADFQSSCVWPRLGTTALAKPFNDEPGIAVAAGATAIGLPESNVMAL